jgi:hypothetical protein
MVYTPEYDEDDLQLDGHDVYLPPRDTATIPGDAWVLEQQAISFNKPAQSNKISEQDLVELDKWDKDQDNELLESDVSSNYSNKIPNITSSKAKIRDAFSTQSGIITGLPSYEMESGEPCTYKVISGYRDVRHKFTNGSRPS